MDTCKRILTVFALLFMAAGGILTLATPDKEFSESENRYLDQAPELSLKSVVDGDYQSEIKDYLADQMIFRDDYMKLYAMAQKTLGKSEYNGIYLCDDDWLIEVYKEPVKTEWIAEKFAGVPEYTDAKCTLMLVPTAISIYDEVLPEGAAEHNKQSEVRDYIYSHAGMDTVDVWSVLEENKDKTQLYYKTDHHWTTDAAYLAYAEYCDHMGFEPVPESEFDKQVVSNEFFGTIYSKALTAFQPADKITAYKQDMSGITVTYQAGEGSLYNEEFLTKKDKYAYFLNGNQAMITIENENVNNDRVLLVVKDSYANSMVPFLVNHFEKIVVLDTRYYRMGVSTTAEDIGATDILFLFNLNTLDSDTAIAGIY